MSQTLVDALCQELASRAGWFYSTTAALPADQVPVTVAGAPPSPDSVVTVNTYGSGPEPDSRNGWEYPRLQVRTRAVDPLEGIDLDRQAYDALQAASGPLPGGTWVLQDCYALQSEPQPLGTDDNGRWEFVRNYQLSTERAQ